MEENFRRCFFVPNFAVVILQVTCETSKMSN